MCSLSTLLYFFWFSILGLDKKNSIFSFALTLTQILLLHLLIHSQLQLFEEKNESILLAVLFCLGTYSFNLIAFNRLSHSFTCGEWILLSQTVSLYSRNIWESIYRSDNERPDQLYIATQGLNLGILLVGVLLSPVIKQSAKLNCSQSQEHVGNGKKFVFYNLAFYVGGIVVVFGILQPWMSHMMLVNPWIWIFDLLLWNEASYQNLELVFYWSFILIVTLLVIQPNQLQWRPTILRKYFHALTLIMFLPSLLFAHRFTVIALSVGFALLVGLEYVRYGCFWPFGSNLDHYMKLFVDDRDEGPLILTHIYLLLGSAVTIWLDMNSKFGTLARFSGLVIISVGDSLVWQKKRTKFYLAII